MESDGNAFGQETFYTCPVAEELNVTIFTTDWAEAYDPRRRAWVQQCGITGEVLRPQMGTWLPTNIPDCIREFQLYCSISISVD